MALVVREVLVAKTSVIEGGSGIPVVFYTFDKDRIGCLKISREDLAGV